TVLVGVGYFGSVITIQHNITIAARYAARTIAMESTEKAIDRTEGTYVIRLTEKNFREKAIKALPHFDEKRIKVEPVPAKDIAFLTTSVASGKFEPVIEGKGFVFLYKKNGRITEIHKTKSNEIINQLTNMDVGIGTLFYGLKLTYRL